MWELQQSFQNEDYGKNIFHISSCSRGEVVGLFWLIWIRQGAGQILCQIDKKDTRTTSAGIGVLPSDFCSILIWFFHCEEHFKQIIQ